MTESQADKHPIWALLREVRETVGEDTYRRLRKAVVDYGQLQWGEGEDWTRYELTGGC